MLYNQLYQLQKLKTAYQRNTIKQMKSQNRDLDNRHDRILMLSWWEYKNGTTTLENFL